MRVGTYHGVRTDNRAVVTVGTTTATDGKLLDLYLGVHNHSPDGFEWGYGGSGPSQLALAICCNVLGVDPRAKAPRLGEDAPPALARALRLYQLFKARWIVHLPGQEWWLTRDQVLTALADLEAATPSAG